MTSTSHAKRAQKLIYWVSIIVLFLFSIIAGFLGFQQYFRLHGEEFTWLRSLYRTIQIFTFEGGDLETPIPWLLHIVRFSAPLTAMMAIILAILEIFREQWSRLKISRMKDHVVIIGLGTKGKNVMEESIRNHEKVLVIEDDPLNPHLESIKQAGAELLTGNATNLNVLKKARITKAKTVYLLMGDDSQQVRACLLIYQLIKESRRNKEQALNCIMHLLTKDYLNTLRNHNLVQNADDGLELNMFNVYENSARELFQVHPPDRLGLAAGSNQFVQMIIIGFGHAGEALALQTGITGHYLNREQVLPRVVIFDRQADEKVKDFTKRYPSFSDHCVIVAESLEAHSPQMIPELVSYLEEANALNTVVCCFDNKTNNMLLGLQIESLKTAESPLSFELFIRTDDNESFRSSSMSLKPYGLPSKVCSQQAILGGDLDIMAKAFHSIYLEIKQSSPGATKSQADVPWEELKQEYKDSNRKAADHIGVKIRGLGYRIVDMEEDGTPESLSGHIEVLTALEHRRWAAERSLSGWRYDPKRNNETRKTPNLVDWSKLDENIQDFDRKLVAHIPKVLELVHKKIVK